MVQAQTFDPFATEAFDQAKPSGSGVYFDPGFYPEVEIDVAKLVKSGQNSDVFFIVECLIKKSEVASRPAGSKASWLCNFRHQPTMANVRQFIANATRQSFESISRDVCKGVVSMAQPLKGTILSLQVVTIQTKVRKTDFNKHTWNLVKLSPTMQQMLSE